MKQSIWCFSGVLFLSLCLLPSTSARAAEAATEAAADSASYLPETEILAAPAGVAPIDLQYNYVKTESVRLFVNGRLWDEGVDYRVRYRSGQIVPLRSWRPVVQNSKTNVPEKKTKTKQEKVLIIVSYHFLPVTVYARRDLRPVGQPPQASDLTGSGNPSNFTLGALRNSAKGMSQGAFTVSGSKTIQVSTGSRREMTVDQNLRLTLNGQLTNDIRVRAFLSDDNLPVVPEGNTEELRDIDKVLVQLQAPNWQATLGDFVAERQGTTFGNYRRKLQGVSLAAKAGKTNIEVLAGSPRGLYRTLQIRGQESNQGPYYLGGGTSGNSLFIVAGSERVNLNGDVMVRGSDKDYIVDYVRGTITFTYRQLITAETMIVVEFEEGEGPYSRTVVGGGASTGFALPIIGTSGQFTARIIKEKDDPHRLRTGELGEQDEAILEAAGDDPLLAVASGVVVADPGTGVYDQDTSGEKTIYVYNADGGSYNLVMFHTGSNQGDYALDQLTATGEKIYVYKGDGLGSYKIGRPLAMPEAHSVTTLSATVGDTSAVQFNAEWNVSNFNKNQLSNIDDNDNSGNAIHLTAQMKSKAISIADLNLGRVNISGRFKNRSAEFRSFQVNRTVFSYEKWGLSDRARQPGFVDQSDRESTADVAWQIGAAEKQLRVTGNWGSLKHGVNLQANQLSGRAAWQWFGGRGNHYQQSASATDDIDPLAITRVNRRHEMSWKLGPIVPSGSYSLQRWIDDTTPTGRAHGYRYEEVGAGLKSDSGKHLEWSLSFKRGLVDSLYANDWQGQRDSRTYRLGVSSGRVAGMRLVGEGTMRRVIQNLGPTETTRLARINIAGQWDNVGSDWSLGYRVDNSRTEVMDAQVLFVGDKQGDYNQDGEYVGRNLGDHNFVMVGTDSLVATTSVKADVHWRQNFSFLGADRWYGAWSSFTLATLGSRSTTENIGGLLSLDPAVLFDRNTTVLGDISLAQELTLLQHRKKVDLRTKFDFRQARDRQFADHPEDRINRAWQVQSSYNVSSKSSLNMRWRINDERRASLESNLSARRSFNSLSKEYEFGWSFRPGSNIRLAIKSEYITRLDEVSTVSQKELALRPNARYRFKKKWTVQAELRLADVTSEEPFGVVRPWFYAYPGRNVDSSLRLSWDPSQFMSVSLSWFGRKQGDRRWQHDIRLESTARF